ncbi:hypothetical protein COV20_03695 [Candidatus Woesearchaeota archaeon CG10_big_fil_rev_8_21_14_0_10_45_16]|nr:MAG: hypothetical protein COV20_03695 [Candidatus Woesearchaeota archaeon CG10_big_fil_rev_8_21_14_0_10_45_16]
METANIGKRLLAHIIDGFVYIGIFFVTTLILVLTLGYGDLEKSAIIAIGTYFAFCLLSGFYFILIDTFWVGRKGYTIGKKAMGLRIVSVDEERITYGKAFLRALIKFGFIMFVPFTLIAHFIMIVAREDHKGLADLAAETKVIAVLEDTK